MYQEMFFLQKKHFVISIVLDDHTFKIVQISHTYDVFSVLLPQDHENDPICNNFILSEIGNFGKIFVNCKINRLKFDGYQGNFPLFS